MSSQAGWNATESSPRSPPPETRLQNVPAKLAVHEVARIWPDPHRRKGAEASAGVEAMAVARRKPRQKVGVKALLPRVRQGASEAAAGEDVGEHFTERSHGARRGGSSLPPTS